LKNRERILQHEQQRSTLEGFETQLQQMQDSLKEATLAMDEEKRGNMSLKAAVSKIEASLAEADASMKHGRMKKQVQRDKIQKIKSDLRPVMIE
jgi:CHASE3 domain sensor protein